MTARFSTKSQPTSSESVGGSGFSHLKNGLKMVLQFNPSSVLLLCLITVVSSVVLNFIFVFSLVYIFLNSLGENFVLSILRLAIFGLILIIAATLISSFFQLALTRGIVASVKTRTIGVGDALLFAKNRFRLAVLTNIRIFLKMLALFLGFYAAAAIIGSIDSVITTLLSVALIFCMIVVVVRYALRILYVQYVLADDRIPPTPKGVIAHSEQLWKISRRAVTRYILLTFVLSIGFLILYAIIFGLDSAQDTQTSRGLASETTSEINVLSMFVNNSIGALVGLIFASGFAHIYGQANILLRNRQPHGTHPGGPQIIHPPAQPEPAQTASTPHQEPASHKDLPTPIEATHESPPQKSE